MTTRPHQPRSLRTSLEKERFSTSFCFGQGTFQTGRTTLGVVFPCVLWLSPTRPHPLSCSAVEGRHSFAEETPWPAGHRGAAASRPRPTSKRLVSGRFMGWRSMSRIITLVDTPGASLHTRAAADSRVYLRRPNTPTCAQWPRESSGRPPRKLREEGGKGSQSSNTLNEDESILDSRLTGKHVKGDP